MQRYNKDIEYIYLEYVPLILRNYKKLKTTNFVRFTISSFLRAQYVLVKAAQKVSRK